MQFFVVLLLQDIYAGSQQPDQSDHSDQPESLESHRPTPGKTSLTPAKVWPGREREITLWLVIATCSYPFFCVRCWWRWSVTI